MARIVYGPVPHGKSDHYRVASYENGKLSLGVRKFSSYEEAKEASRDDRGWGEGPMTVVFVADRKER